MCLFCNNISLIKENQRLREELMEIRGKEFIKNLLAPYQNRIIGTGLGDLGCPSRPPLMVIGEDLDS